MKRLQGTAESQGDLGNDIVTGIGGLGEALRDDTMHHIPAVACQSGVVESGMGN